MSVPENAPHTSPETRRSYNPYIVVLHWTIAGLILFMIFLGWRLGDHDSMRLSRTNLHKSVGILILLLSFVRLGIRLATKAPAEPPMPGWQLLAAKTLHVGFYVIMIGMPLTGWLMVSTSAREIPFFGIPWPHLPVPQTRETHELFETIHGLIAKLIIYLMVPLHVAAALKHQFIDKDEVVEHMVPGLTPRPLLNWRWIVPVGVILAAVGCGYGIYRGTPQQGGNQPPPEGSSPPAMSSAAAEGVSSAASASPVAASTVPASSASSSSHAAGVTKWTVDKSASKIGWSTTFQGEAINGRFDQYDATIGFDPSQLEKSHVRISIALDSVVSGDEDRDGTLRSDQFFYTGKFPKAIYESSKFSHIGGINYVAHGFLTIHGISKPFDLPFALLTKDDRATVTALVDLDRTAFGVGSGDYASTDAIPAKVNVAIKLRAKAAK
ncbi:MAG: cytochrome b/b6 domain-containing protein [Asticcacaulis sp.]